MYFFTSDEHYNHYNIIKYCNRPFENINDMNKTLVNNFNSVVGKNDITIHCGDFYWGTDGYEDIVKQLNGNHGFLRGDHDRWMKKNKSYPFMWRKRIDDIMITACHYAMRVWHTSHYNSWQVYGHSHGTLKPIGKQWDVGVDNNNFFPVSFNQLKLIMEKQSDNFNLINRRN